MGIKMKSMMRKTTLREIKQSFGRFFAIFAIVALGVSFFAGLKVTKKVMTGSADKYLKDGEKITIADMTCKLIATPGHTVGSCCYYFEEAGILIAGDTLFTESVGRTDLATGSMSALSRSIKERLFALPDETKVYPGHGESTTIGHEKQYNPFAQ